MSVLVGNRPAAELEVGVDVSPIAAGFEVTTRYISSGAEIRFALAG